MFCKKCGEVIPAGAEFCMSCGTKVDSEDKTKTVKDDKTSKEIKSQHVGIENKPSAFHVEKKPEVAKKKESSKLKIGKFEFKRKTLIIIISAIIGVLLIGSIGYFCFSEFTPQGQYAKGYRIYKELCSYQSIESDQKPLACDSKCLELLDQGRECFDQAKDYSDAKVYYYCFKAMSNLFRTNNN